MCLWVVVDIGGQVRNRRRQKDRARWKGPGHKYKPKRVGIYNETAGPWEVWSSREKDKLARESRMGRVRRGVGKLQDGPASGDWVRQQVRKECVYLRTYSLSLRRMEEPGAGDRYRLVPLAPWSPSFHVLFFPSPSPHELGTMPGRQGRQAGIRIMVNLLCTVTATDTLLALWRVHIQ